MVKIVAAAAIVAVAVTTQQPPASPQQPTFRTGTELVRVDVTVLDNRARPVANLEATDFVVFEDDVPQKIQTFRMLQLDGTPGPDDDLTLTIGSRETHRLHELARDDVRMFVVFWDEYHILPDPRDRLLREHLVEFLKKGLGPTDLVAVMNQWTPMSELTFSRDRYRLGTDGGALRGRQGDYIPRNVAEENHLRIREGPEWARARVSVSALKSAILHLGTVRESRKVILYVGREFGLGPDTSSATQDLIEAANASNVAIYSINPVGLLVTGSNMRNGLLASLAYNTGGESFLSNSPLMAMGRAVSQATVSYLIGYAPSPLRQDGRFHKIRVKVKGDYDVRARNGYWAPDAAAKDKARKDAADAALPSPIEAAFSELVRLGRRELEDDAHEARTVLVPEDPSPALSIAAPLLWRVQRPADLKTAMAGAEPAYKGREFTRMERIVARISVDGSQAAGARLSIALIDRRGKRLSELPFTTNSHGAILDLPLQSIARGDYLIAIEAAQGEVKAAAYLPIRINDR